MILSGLSGQEQTRGLPTPAPLPTIFILLLVYPSSPIHLFLLCALSALLSLSPSLHHPLFPAHSILPSFLHLFIYSHFTPGLLLGALRCTSGVVLALKAGSPRTVGVMPELGSAGRVGVSRKSERKGTQDRGRSMVWVGEKGKHRASSQTLKTRLSHPDSGL